LLRNSATKRNKNPTTPHTCLLDYKVPCAEQRSFFLNCLFFLFCFYFFISNENEGVSWWENETIFYLSFSFSSIYKSKW
jgi:hypothetical protein